MTVPAIGAVLLGAGQARRFGSDKRFARINHIPVASHTVERYRSVFDDVTVVVRPDDDALCELLAGPGVRFVHAPDAHLGMGHSLSAAFTNPRGTYVFVGLLDMPFVEAQTLATLCQRAAEHGYEKIIQPCDSNPSAQRRHGHPLGWPRRFFPQLAKLKGDQGARQILADNGEQVVSVQVHDTGIHRDIDHPDDLPSGPPP